MLKTKTKINWATEQEVSTQLSKLDFELWFKRTNKSNAKKHIEKLIGKRVHPSMFKKLREGGGLEWWGNPDRPRRSPSSESLLDAKGWELLRAAVRNCADVIRDMTIDEAVAVVSIECRCNARTLRGLNSDLQVWKK